MKKVYLILPVVLASPAAICADKFQPYEISPGFSYYSDQYSSSNGISELGEEKNYEEIYQFYNYYEAIFDNERRIVTFKAYKQGVLEYSETYFYSDDGRLLKKVVKNPDGTESVTDF